MTLKSVIFALIAASAVAASAQDILVPEDLVTDIETGCEVYGLDPDGDGFLALRTGPGVTYEKIGELRNGDTALVAATSCPDGWCYVENGSMNGENAKFRGWIDDKWCNYYP